MKMVRSRCLLLMLMIIQTVLGTEEHNIIDKDVYPWIDEMFGNQEGQFDGFTVYPFNVTTEDGWSLTLFRITTWCSGTNILLMGDTFMDTEKWLKDYFIGTPMPL